MTGATRLLAPVLYPAAVVPAALAMLFSAAWVDYNRNPELLRAIPPLLVGMAILGFCSWLLLRMERLRLPSGRDHLRRCLLLHATALPIGVMLVATYETHGRGIGYGYGVVLVFVASLAIVADALILLLLARLRSRGDCGRAVA